MRFALLLVLGIVGCGSDPDVHLGSDGGADARDGMVDSTLPDTALDGGPTVDPVRAANVCAALEELIANSSIPGGVVGVRLDDGATHYCVAGVSDITTNQPIAVSDRFRIGSVTKTFVAATVLLLVEDGMISLDDSLSRWVPGFMTDPTLAQMLNHTSGLGEYLFESEVRADSTRARTQDELVQFARTLTPVRDPGGRFEYSNTNYLAMGSVIEAAAGAPWWEVVRSRLIDPLRLSNTFVDGFEPVAGGHIPGYEDRNGMLVHSSAEFHQSIASAAGCMVSNVPDLLTWGAALYDGTLLSAGSLQEMMVNRRVPQAHDMGVYENAFVSLGNFVEVNDELDDFHGHSGGTPGFAANLRYMERDGITQVILLNGVATSEQLNGLTNDIWIAMLL